MLFSGIQPWGRTKCRSQGEVQIRARGAQNRAVMGDRGKGLGDGEGTRMWLLWEAGGVGRGGEPIVSAGAGPAARYDPAVPEWRLGGRARRDGAGQPPADLPRGSFVARAPPEARSP